MKKKRLIDVLKPEGETVAVSAIIPAELHATVKAELKKDGRKVNDLILAAFNLYLEEKKSAPAAGRSKE